MLTQEQGNICQELNNRLLIMYIDWAGFGNNQTWSFCYIQLFKVGIDRLSLLLYKVMG